jgi:3',5'-cyclic AMP phosphodiesterase CpdA
MSEVIRFAVFSDIHAGVPSHSDTHVFAEPPASTPKENPLSDLPAFIRTRGLAADWVLNPGDLANRANTGGQLYGWNRLDNIKSALGAGAVIGSVGNHDLETHSPTADSAVILKNLSPAFPTVDPFLNSSYWADGFYLDDSNDNFRLLNINTCADFPPHPGAIAALDEEQAYKLALDRGGVSVERLHAIEARLADLAWKPVNILLLHHHPIEHQRRELLRDTYGPMANGTQLLEVLETSSGPGRWLVIHGHKHLPDFDIDGPSGNSPMLLCAASVGGKLWPPVSTVARNQFHIVEFEIETVAGLPRTRGTVASYAWSFGEGWGVAYPNTGLPASFGFGLLDDYRNLAAQVLTIFESK